MRSVLAHLSRGARRALQRSAALIVGLVVIGGAQASAADATTPTSIDDRVAAVREQLVEQEAADDVAGDAEALGWCNWSNWNNWHNWHNWSNWCNW